MLNGSTNRAAAPCGGTGHIGGYPAPKGIGACPRDVGAPEYIVAIVAAFAAACAPANRAPFATAPFFVPALLARFDDERFPFSSSLSTSAASVAKSNNASATSRSLPRNFVLDDARGFARGAGFDTYSHASQIKTPVSHRVVVNVVVVVVVVVSGIRPAS